MKHPAGPPRDFCLANAPDNCQEHILHAMPDEFTRDVFLSHSAVIWGLPENVSREAGGTAHFPCPAGTARAFIHSKNLSGHVATGPFMLGRRPKPWPVAA